MARDDDGHSWRSSVDSVREGLIDSSGAHGKRLNDEEVRPSTHYIEVNQLRRNFVRHRFTGAPPPSALSSRQHGLRRSYVLKST